MKNLRAVLAALVVGTILHGGGGRLRAGDAEPPLYLVLFRLTLNADGKSQDAQAIKVIDLLSGSNNAVPVELPPAFLDQARQQAAADPPQKPTDTLMSFLYVPDDGRHGPAKVSFGLLNGVAGSVINYRLLGRDAAQSNYGKGFGRSALFVSYYAVGSLPKATAEQRRAIVDAEILRNVANLQNAEVLSRRDLSTDAQTVVEVTCKSAANKALTLRCRYLCNDRQVLALTVITPDGTPAEEARSVEQLFDAFRFR